MATSKNKVIPKRNPGRPATGTDPVRAIRLSDGFLATVDHWASKQHDKPGRSEAIRRLVEIGLSKTSEQPRASSKQSATRAAELAAKAINKHLDPQAPLGEREVRKRKLIEGPSVFRDTRRDGPKKK
jgi:hypothetical protein